jgi:lysophospholipase L1-like esterase
MARALGVDALNLGTSGTAYCEPAIAEYVAGREDWDVATLALSVNMANRGFTVAQFRERAANLVDAVAGADPDRPVVAVSLFPYHADVVAGDDPERARAFRSTLREAVAASSHDNLHVVAGEDLLDVTGLTTDLLHPGDAGHGAIADGLATAVEHVLD